MKNYGTPSRTLKPSDSKITKITEGKKSVRKLKIKKKTTNDTKSPGPQMAVVDEVVG